MTATPGHILGRTGALEWETKNLRALNLITLGNVRCEGLDKVAQELRGIADDLSRQERAREKAETKSTEGGF